MSLTNRSETTHNNQQMSVPQREFVTLDGLRGVAAFAVVAGHLANGRETAGGLLVEYYLAVDFFFALSVCPRTY
jgi:peptidoglycan/LPS O-acetylase OafA/YrhL